MSRNIDNKKLYPLVGRELRRKELTILNVNVLLNFPGNIGYQCGHICLVDKVTFMVSTVHRKAYSTIFHFDLLHPQPFMRIRIKDIPPMII